MPETNAAPRTKKVSTTTTEELPVDAGERQGLGMPWQEYLATVPEEELEITTIYVYRKDPATIQGFVYKSGGEGKTAERIDDQWLQDHFGGGTFDLTIRSKSGKSHYERGVKIAGEPKLTDKEKPAVSATAAPAADSSVDRLATLLDKTLDRLDRMQAAGAQPSAAQDATVTMLVDASKKAVELVSGNRPVATEGKLESDLERLKLLRDIFLPAKQEDEFDKQLKQAFLKKLLDPPAESKTLIDQLEGLGRVRELLGWGGDAGGGGKEHWTTALIHQVPALLDGLSQVSQARLQTAQTELQRANVIARSRPGAPPAQPVTAQAVPVQTSTNRPPAPGPAPEAGPLNMRPMGEPGAPPPMADNPVVVMPAAIDTESPAVVNFVKHQVVEMVESGQPGGGIVAFLIGMRQGKFVEMLTKHTPEQISAFLRMDPILKTAVDNEDWPDILKEAQDYVHELREGQPVQ
jgi:hypothetical protein